MDIEEEIQARVDFKMKELLKAIEHKAKANWNLAFCSGHPKHQFYLEAFSQMKSMFKKEMEMPLPCNNMSELKKQNQRDRMTEKIVERLDLRGRRGAWEKEMFIYKCLEELQNEK